MLTDEQRAILQTRYDEASEALHKLRTGAMVVQIGTDTERLQYAAVDQARLAAYVASLQSQLGLTPRARAIGVSFR